jgi:2-haloacid dehalogenase
VVASFTILTTSIVIDNSRSNDMVWDCVIPCEMLGIYKTHPESYRLAARFLRLKPREIMMVACHNFDLLAARKEGFRSAFVRRPQEWGPSGPPDPVADPSHDIVVDSFDELATRLDARRDRFARISGESVVYRSMCTTIGVTPRPRLRSISSSPNM